MALLVALGGAGAGAGCARAGGRAALEGAPGPVQETALALAESGAGLEACDTVFALEHFVDVGDGAVLHVREAFTLDSLLHWPRRALLMLTATVVTNAQWNAAVPGDESFNALARAAHAGFFAFAASYEGYGDSTIPDDGRTVTAERLLDEMGEVVDWIRAERHLPRVDLLGASLGSALAVALGGRHSSINRHHVGRVVVTANVYRGVRPELAPFFFSPELRMMLESAPGGYVTTGPEMYGLVLTAADPAAAAWAFGAFPGTYAVGPTLEGFDLPVFDAADGRAPLLQIWGDADPITPLEDVTAFQDEYGGDASLVVLAGGGHSPYYEPVRDTFWDETFAFLEADEGVLVTCAELVDALDGGGDDDD